MHPAPGVDQPTFMVMAATWSVPAVCRKSRQSPALGRSAVRRAAHTPPAAGLPLRALSVAVGLFVHDAPHACCVAASIEKAAGGTDPTFA